MQIRWFLACLFVLSVIPGCKRCVTRELPSLYFYPSETEVVPYHAGDTLRFRCLESGRISGFRVLPVQTGMDRYEEGDPHDLYTSGCIGQYYYSESVNTPLDDGTSFLKLSMDNVFTSTGPIKKFVIQFRITSDTVPLWFSGSYQVGPDTLITGNDPVSAYFAVLTMGNRNFYHVYELKGERLGNSYDYLSTAYYTLDEGLVGFVTCRRHTWYLYEE